MSTPSTTSRHGQRAAASGEVVGSQQLGVARQPILDASLRVVGYELLFRSSAKDSAGVVDSAEATSRVIVDGLMEVGLDELVGQRRAYINCTRTFLLGMRPMPLPPARVILELLEDQTVDCALLSVLDELIADGFSLALDDFVWTEDCEPLLERADIVKIDVLAYSEADLVELVHRLRARPRPLVLLAEKVETREDFERYQALGFDAFQGYFFARPTRMHARAIPSQNLQALSAMSQLTFTEDYEALERIISRDVGLSIRLLRYANSAQIYLPRRVTSVHDALTIIGAITVRRWAMMLVFAGIRDTPHELLVTALVRAHMCRLLAGTGRDSDGDTHFTIGLFSVADALLDAPMAAVVDSLPFNAPVATALLDHAGAAGQVLGCVLAYESGDFDAIEGLGPPLAVIDDAYRHAIAIAERDTMSLA